MEMRFILGAAATDKVSSAVKLSHFMNSLKPRTRLVVRNVRFISALD